MPESVPEEPSRPGGARDPARLARLLTAFGVLVAIAILALGAVMLRDARGEAWRRTRQDSENLALTLARDIERACKQDRLNDAERELGHLDAVAGRAQEALRGLRASLTAG